MGDGSGSHLVLRRRNEVEGRGRRNGARSHKRDVAGRGKPGATRPSVLVLTSGTTKKSVVAGGLLQRFVRGKPAFIGQGIH